MRRSLLFWTFCTLTLLGGSVKTSQAQATSDKVYDLVIYGGTPGGIAMAVRAAREGTSVLLVNRLQHLGGMLSSGLGVWDTLYDGRRAPVYDELRQGIYDFCRKTYGKNSLQYREAFPGPRTQSSPRGYYAPHVAEAVIDKMVKGEKNITALKGYIPIEVQQSNRIIQSVTFREFHGNGTVRISAAIFADASYEGDLMALAKAPYRVGREARSEFAEPHAGEIFTKLIGGDNGLAKFPKDAVEGHLNLRGFRVTTGPVCPGGSGKGDKAIEAYNYRLYMSKDPSNIALPAAPANYRREDFLRKGDTGTPSGDSWNGGTLPGQNQDYPDGNWATREAIAQRHLYFMLGGLYFAQNDESVPANAREKARQVGLAKDEFTDNGHIPYEIYARETRRLVGRYIFTEHDALPAPGLNRSPLHEDSIAITEWPIDVHQCTDHHGPEGGVDGKVLLTEESRPGEVPYRTLLSTNLDNLMVPVCISSTHIGWGAIRLEPTWMNIGESAGFAAAQAIKKRKAPSQIDTDELLRSLATRHVMISFFNDVDLSSDAMWIPAVEYLGTKGFFRSYDAFPTKPLTAVTAQLWAKTFGKLAIKTAYDPTSQAQSLPESEAENPLCVTVEQFADLLKKASPTSVTTIEDAKNSLGLKDAEPINRADACRLVFEALTHF